MARHPTCADLPNWLGQRGRLSRRGMTRVMPSVLPSVVLLGAQALLPPMAGAQPAIPSGLAPGAVAVVGGFVFARARGPIRDPLAPLQSFLASRASFNAARWLCQYTPTPDTRLDATLTGVSVVEARSEGDQLTVTVRLQMQRPDCVVRSVPPNTPSGAPELSADLPSAYQPLSPYSGQPARPSEIN